MAVDFDGLVNGPIIATFGDDREILPTHIRDSIGGPWHPVDGIFERSHAEAFTADEAPAQSTRRVTFFLRLVLLPPGFLLENGAFIRRGRESWQVSDVQPDSMGGALLVLGARTGGPSP